MWALHLMARTSVATGAGNYRLGRGFSINVRNEFQLLLSTPRSHNWQTKKKMRLFANCTAGQENNLKTFSIRYFGRRLSTNNPCQVSRLRRFVTKQEMEGETCFISWYNEVLCPTNRCDNITVLDTLSPFSEVAVAAFEIFAPSIWLRALKEWC